jgi:hypothetical protein
VLKGEGIKAHHTTHLFRHVGAENLETDADGLLQPGQTDRLGGWNMDVMQKIYQGLPVQAIMVQGGHPPTHFNDAYIIPESPLKAVKPPTEILKGFSKLYIASSAWLDFTKDNPDAILGDGMPICGSSMGFASLCVHLTEVLVEVAPFIQALVPDHSLFKSAQFNNPAFVAYALEQRRSAAVRDAAEPSSAVGGATSTLESPLRRAFHAVSSQIAGLGANVAAQLSTMLRAVTDGPREQQQQQPATFNFDLVAAPLLAQTPLLLEDGAPPAPHITINVLPTPGVVQPVGKLSRTLTSVIDVWKEKTEGIHGQRPASAKGPWPAYTRSIGSRPSIRSSPSTATAGTASAVLRRTPTRRRATSTGATSSGRRSRGSPASTTRTQPPPRRDSRLALPRPPGRLSRRGTSSQTSRTASTPRRRSGSPCD